MVPHPPPARRVAAGPRPHKLEIQRAAGGRDGGTAAAAAAAGSLLLGGPAAVSPQASVLTSVSAASFSSAVSTVPSLPNMPRHKSGRQRQELVGGGGINQVCVHRTVLAANMDYYPV